MLEKCKNAQERWGGVSEIIDNWLDERQELIKTFVALPSAVVGEDLNNRLSQFCGLLVDYLSSGHFEVYEQLLREGHEFNDGSVESAKDILPLIQDTTDAALDFNDDYDAFEKPTVAQIREFGLRLSKLGESLEERFRLEDEMIAVLHDAHREQVIES